MKDPWSRFVLLVGCAGLLGLATHATVDPPDFLIGVGLARSVGKGTNKITMEVAFDVSHRGETFEEEWLLFSVKDSTGAMLAKKSFRSSYGEFRIDAIDVDGDGLREFVFITGEGRGTSARRETLDIEPLENGLLRTIVSCPRSDFYEAGKRWWYAISFKDTDKNGTTDVELQLCADDEAGFNEGPAEQVKIFKWVRKSKSDELTKVVEVRKARKRPR
jgi:hypothetical protein